MSTPSAGTSRAKSAAGTCQVLYIVVEDLLTEERQILEFDEDAPDVVSIVRARKLELISVAATREDAERMMDRDRRSKKGLRAK